jgi:hypothetical protein
MRGAESDRKLFEEQSREAFMTKISDLGTSSSCPVGDSLSIIRQTQVQLHALTDVTTTANVLTTRMQLCDVLLGEISGIRSRLAKDLRRTREPPRALI